MCSSIRKAPVAETAAAVLEEAGWEALAAAVPEAAGSAAAAGWVGRVVEETEAGSAVEAMD